MKKKRGSDMSGYIQNPGHLIVEAQLSMQWLPIETAPKGYQDVILFIPRADDRSSNTIVIAHRLGKHWSGINMTHIGCDMPTHWMELPEPPKED